MLLDATANAICVCVSPASEYENDPKWTSVHPDPRHPIFTDDSDSAAVVQGVVNALAGSNDKRKYAPPHAGWVGISSYTDMHGNFRVKTETLVASSSITADSGDDEILADS